MDPMVSAMWSGDWDVRWFESIDSTNTFVRAEARRGASEGLVAVADHHQPSRCMVRAAATNRSATASKSPSV